MAVDGDGAPVRGVSGEGRAAWFCAYTPIELLSAAGLEPVRLFGAPGSSDSADSILGTNICPYVRACLEQGLAGDAPAAAVFTGCCDSMRRLHDAWSHYCRHDLTHIMYVPRSTGGTSLELYRDSITGLASAVEAYTGTEITADRLGAAIVERSLQDALLAGIVERGGNGRRLTSERYLAAFTDAQSLPAGEFRRRHGEGFRPATEDGPRWEGKAVIVTGNLVRPGGLLEVIDSCGGEVASLDLCSAERYVTWDGAVDASRVLGASRGELVDELARRYLSRTPCPRMLNRAERHELLAANARRLGARGVIIVPLMFCDPFLFDLPALESHLDAAGIPSLVLQSDYQDENAGQLTTRVEAFLEMI